MPDPSSVLWDDWLLLLVQGLTLVFLIVYVVKTWQMASATRVAAQASSRAAEESYQARMQSLAPRVLVYLNPSEFFFAEIIVENVGAGTARNVSFQFDPPLVSTENHEPQRFFENPKSVIPPGSRMRHHFDTWPALLNSENPKKYTVTVTYEGVENRGTYSVEHVLDVADYQHRMELKKKNLHDLVGELVNLRKALEQYLRDEKSDRKSYQAQRRYAGNRRESLETTLGAIRVKWPLLRDLALEGGYDVWWDPLLEDLRSEAITALVLCQRQDHRDSTRKAVAEFTDALLHRARSGDDTWLEQVNTAYERIVGTTGSP